MKYMMFVMTVVLCACYGNAADYPLPKGYTRGCGTDADCNEGEMCWFANTEGTRPVCMPAPYNYQWRAY